MICIATQSINPHQQQQEDDQHYGHYTTFTQALLSCKRGRSISIYSMINLMNFKKCKVLNRHNPAFTPAVIRQGNFHWELTFVKWSRKLVQFYEDEKGSDVYWWYCSFFPHCETSSLFSGRRNSFLSTAPEPARSTHSATAECLTTIV